ncbi:MAG: FHA domain-containing protein [Eubacterium sp.]|nr:FHA domain-containing protein [Eubacterium sp.]
MFCGKCGASIDDGSAFCPNCGASVGNTAPNAGPAPSPAPAPGPAGYAGPQGGGAPRYGAPGYGAPQTPPGYAGGNASMGQAPAGVPRQGGGIKTIFSAIAAAPSQGDIIEFIVWIGFCVAAALSMTAAILSGENGGAMSLWIVMMIMNLGLAAILTFRLKPIMLLTAYTVFNFILLIPFYKLGADINGVFDSASPIIIVLFIFDLLLAIVLVTLASIQFFSSKRFDTALIVFSFMSLGLTLALMMCTRFVTSGGRAANSFYDPLFSDASYFFGGFTYLFTLALIAFFTLMFFKGAVDSTKATITGGTIKANLPMVYFEAGFNVGNSVYLTGQDVVIGSEPGSGIMVPDPDVSPRHCVVRFNRSSGYFEMCDISSTGTFVNGQPLPKNQYVSLQKGTVVQIGSVRQQLRLV